MDNYIALGYLFLGARAHSSPNVYLYSIKPYWVFTQYTGFSDVSRTRIHQNLKFNFLEVASYFLLYSESTFSHKDNLFLEHITYAMRHISNWNVSIKTWSSTFLRLPAIFHSTAELRFPTKVTFSWSASHMQWGTFQIEWHHTHYSQIKDKKIFLRKNLWLANNALHIVC